MNVLIIQPGFPAEIPYFVRGLAQAGARVFGVGDQPSESLPSPAKDALSGYLRVSGHWDGSRVLEALRRWEVPVRLDSVECLWEPLMMLAAEIREAFGLPGMDAEQTLLFRDKEKMKKALQKAGVRTPRHRAAVSAAACRDAAGEIGYPLIIKPISGAGSAHTFRVGDAAELERVLGQLGSVAKVAVEEFIEGKEFTFDTICANGEVLYHNIAWYRPNVLTARSEQWVSPQTITLREMDQPGLRKGLKLGMTVLNALGFRSGFTHMEWFLKPNGEAVFGEIAARPPGGRSVELMNYSCDIDVFRGWGEALVSGCLSQKIERKYNAAVIFKRAIGNGRICTIEGLTEIRKRYSPFLCCENLLPIGAYRRDWKQTLISDGYLIVRHPDLEATVEIADYIGEFLKMYAH